MQNNRQFHQHCIYIIILSMKYRIIFQRMMIEVDVFIYGLTIQRGCQ